MMICPNCGTEFEGTYCPSCGQALHMSGQITMKSFWKGVAMSFTRMTPGFWETFVGLILRPWDVIRQYIHGRRIKYSPPVTMVIQLVFYFTFFYTVAEHLFEVNIFSMPVRQTPGKWGWVTDMLASSEVLSKLVIACMIALNCYLSYGLITGRRYNLAEYLTAAIYMGCSFSIYSYMLQPLALLLPDAIVFIKIAIILLIGTISLNKAFPIRQWWRKCLTWLAFIFLNVMVVVIFAIIVVLLTKS